MSGRGAWVYGVILLWVFVAAPLVSCAAGARGLERRVGPEYADEVASWKKMIEAHGETGYWLVVRGYHASDDLIAMSTNSELSHALILDAETASVIEAVAVGVIESPLSRVIEESHRIQLIRPRGWTPERGREAVAKARSVVGSGYDFAGIVGLPFEEYFYCSELAAWSMSIPVDHAGPQHVLHPKNLYQLGELLVDTGERDTQPDAWPSEGTPAG